MAEVGAQSVPKQALTGKLGRSTLLLQGQSMLCWSNGIMTETEEAEIFLTTRHCKAASSFGGSAMNAQKTRWTAGKLVLPLGPHKKTRQGALVVLGRSFVSATLWKLSVLILLLI